MVFPRQAITNSNGFTLLELVLIIVVLSLALPGLLSIFFKGIKDSSDAQVLTSGSVVAQSLMEEIRSKRWDENYPVPPGSYSTIGADTGESRATYDDIDDFNGLNNSPPKDSQGNSLTNLNGYREQVSVCYVAKTALNTCLTSGSSDYKKVTITISTLNGNGPQASIVTVLTNW